MDDDILARVSRATAAKDRADLMWRAAIKQAVEDGESLRSVGRAANVTHVRVLQITRDDQPKPDPAYARAHNAVRKARGAASECSRCGTTDPDKIYEWANLTGNYADVMDYERMCRSCHRQYDKSRRVFEITRQGVPSPRSAP